MRAGLDRLRPSEKESFDDTTHGVASDGGSV